MSLSLKEATKTVAKFLGKDTDAILIASKKLWAWNGTAGCMAPCDEVEGITAVVSGSKFKQAVAALGVNAQIAKPKKSLLIFDDHTRFSLASKTKKDGPPIPNTLTGLEWVQVADHVTAAATALSKLVHHDDGTPFDLDVVRATTEWTAASNGKHLAIVWAPIVQVGAYIPGRALIDLKGGLEIATTDRLVYLRANDGVLRWSRVMQSNWPDSVVNDMGPLRTDARRIAVGLDAVELEKLAANAVASMDTNAEVFTLCLDPRASELSFRGKPARSGGSFASTIDVEWPENQPKEARWVGANPRDLKKLASVVKAGGGTKRWLSVGSKIDGVVLWGGDDVTIEILLMPQHLIQPDLPDGLTA